MSALIPALIKLAMSGRGRGGGGGGGGYSGGGGRGGYGRTPKPQKSDWDWLEENASKQFNRPDNDTDLMTPELSKMYNELRAEGDELDAMIRQFSSE